MSLTTKEKIRDQKRKGLSFEELCAIPSLNKEKTRNKAHLRAIKRKGKNKSFSASAKPKR
ncbi:MAG: hypothetical protein ACRDCN_02770 [Tannerellaceae bacterium]